MFSYRTIIRQAWQITWRSKYLWFFGLFAALLGNGGEYEIVIKGLSGDAQSNLFPDLSQITATGVFSTKTLANLPVLMARDPMSLFLIFLFGVIFLVLFGFLLWLIVISQAGLVNNAALIIGKKKNDFAGAVNSGVKHFWPVFSLNVVLKVAIWLCFILLSLPAFAMFGRANLLTANALYGIGFLLFIPIALAASFIIKYAIAYVVLKGQDFFDGVKQGWDLFRKNWLVSLEMALILFSINLLIGFVLLIVFLILAIPIIFLAFVFYSFASVTGFWLITGLAIILLFITIIAVGSALATFQVSAWTALFIELVGKGAVSKIARAFGWMGK